ncbi:hypothetical protein B9479_002290 [Cryptococcus floricola]|uniref:CCHC-type domain-containing protein n=1 Tax=Cryptococcus floricola TaxID=2591691 RepID=A0A5D3B3C5_9TREE|nr:hypothetical protein B9479_002290 [Cryptococcus floricola]
MPPRIPLPRLTLFTGGKECSLCEVAKEQLTLLRQSHPFEITYWNIRSPPLGIEAQEAKKWRRLYQYDIPVLHLEGRGRVQKHRIDRDKLGKVLEEWRKEQENQASEKGEQQSLLACQRPAEVTEDDGCTTTEYSKPPWRTAIGTAFFSLTCPVRAFRNFSDVPVGSDVPVLKLGTVKDSEIEEGEINEDGEEDIGWEVDTAGKDWVEGDTSWILFEHDDGDEHLKNNRTHLTCWNCGETGHPVKACPLPLNKVMVRYSRDMMYYERDHIPPCSVAPFLRIYLDSRVTEVERQRRLDLNATFVPGRITKELDHAVRWIEDEEAEETGARYRIGELAWIVEMAKWGYPPGWIASQDPIETLHERISSLHTYDSPFPAEDDDAEDLAIIGGEMEGPRQSREDSAMDIDPPSPLTDPPPPPLSPPPQPLSPPPPPPPTQYPPPKRYAVYDTDMFHYGRLAPFDVIAQVPLGFPKWR